MILSFSELKYAFECPYSFKLRFLYGFNLPIAEALGFGKGLHDALFEMHDRVLHDEPVTLGDIPGLVDRHVFLPFAYPDLRETLSESARRRLEEYVNARGATFKDIEFAERPIEIDLGDGIRVSGRIDLIRRRSTNEMVVIDFKSNDRTQQEGVTDLQLRVYALGFEQRRPASARVRSSSITSMTSSTREPTRSTRRCSGKLALPYARSGSDCEVTAIPATSEAPTRRNARRCAKTAT